MKDKSEDALLDIFDWLRFPLIIGVIFSVKAIECVTNNRKILLSQNDTDSLYVTFSYFLLSD